MLVFVEQVIVRKKLFTSSYISYIKRELYDMCNILRELIKQKSRFVTCIFFVPRNLLFLHSNFLISKEPFLRNDEIAYGLTMPNILI